MKRATKFIGILLTFIFVLTGCVTTPPANNQQQNTKAKFYGVINEMNLYVGEEFDPFYGITAKCEKGNIPIDAEWKATENSAYFSALNLRLTISLSLAKT